MKQKSKGWYISHPKKLKKFIKRKRFSLEEYSIPFMVGYILGVALTLLAKYISEN